MIKKYYEHIAYLEDDYEDPNEVLEIVGLPSGLYFEILRKKYNESNISSVVNWSEKYKCYVYRDKDYSKIMQLLDYETPPLTDNNTFTVSKLKEFKIENYKITKDGVIVYGDVNIKYLTYKRLPIKFYKILGDFIINTGILENLDNCPEYVEGNFDCSYNNLKLLTNGPRVVKLKYNCSHNYLENLYGSPVEVNDFDCSHNKLTNLLYGPSIATGDFNCSFNSIKNLKEAPISVLGVFNFSDNKITTLKGMPRDVKRVIKNNNPIF